MENEIENESIVEQKEDTQPQEISPNSMTNPTTPKIEPMITNEQLNQILSKVDQISNQQAMIFEQMKQTKNKDSEVKNDVIKY